MDNSSKIRGIIVIVSALALALWLGVSIVTSQAETVVYSVGAALLLTCIFLGRKIWLLLILFSALNIPLIRGFSTVELGQGLFLGFTLIIFLMRRQPLNIKFGEKEFWMAMLAACIVQVYLRNPVGLNIFGSEAVGARPYFLVTLSFLTGCVLGNIVVAPAEIKWYLKLSIIGSFLGIGLTTLRMRGGDSLGFERTTQLDDGRDSGRIGSLGSLGISLSRVLASYRSPIRALVNPIWAFLILLSFAAAAGSGFRTFVATVGLTYVIGIAYRGGFIPLLTAVVSSAVGLGILAIVNVASPLPPNVQRALSPFPGTWEKRQVEAAEESTEWRVEMWKEALFTDYWIHNKILGDGLGLTSKEYQLIQASLQTGGRGLESMGSGMSQQQEAMMITGGYHSGPVQTVRTIGYVGLFVLIIAMVRLAVYAHRQVMRCRGTEWYTLAIFTAIPTVSLPILFIFIFGDFGRDVSAVFLSYGIISLLEKNLPLPAYVKVGRSHYILNRHNLSNASVPK